MNSKRSHNFPFSIFHLPFVRLPFKNLSFACTAIIMLCAMLSLGSCSKKVEMTRIIVEDSIRHYYPLVQGTDLVMQWRIANVGETPLVITDIQPSCGCLIKDSEDNNVIPPGKESLLKFTFHSEKNSGYVKHTIRLFGNIMPEGMACLVFDLHVVPHALSSPDYEELHKKREEFDIVSGVKTLVDGNEAERGYWTNDMDYSRGYNKYYWQEGRK